MPKKKLPVNVWKEKEQQPGRGVILLKPISRDDFPEIGRKGKMIMSNYYYKGNCGKRIPLAEIAIYSLCPVCGAEIKHPDIWDLTREISETGGDLYSTKHLCPACIRRRMTGR